MSQCNKPVFNIKMVENKLLYNMNICWGLIEIVNMVKVHLNISKTLVKFILIFHFIQSTLQAL